MSYNSFHQISRQSVASAAIVCILAGCGSPPTAGSLGHAEQVAASCPTDGSKTAAYVASDGSASRLGLTSEPAQQNVIRDVAERTAICGGHLRVVLFAGSTVAVPVFDGDLKLDGATENARLRKAPTLLDDVMGQINSALPSAQAQLPDGATDVVGQLQPGAEYLTQLSAAGKFRLEETILTDGIQTAGQDLEDPALTEQQATELAGTFAVPDLTGAQVRLIGIGRQADGSLLPTPYVAALKAFHTAVCQRTQATCTVVTDAAGA
ncbi:hypothetical protein MSAS_23960 [Mycobacterium saskatchewanense]|uniref:Uncharacterized protein n=1 Tax=Mycobacterium saskatchewanense TaxID=220927 RepID=A0AAJ3TW81_9MYCO|nr:hypothetical protein [Mycobacterium saskatchewanense]ORW70366.1 hypothetical protein AWC23_17080 [Mycobacterium saskatchewanense]BBX63222.1 hypothetical protein MSAS_23960 [Mycobacterium saskatchewanense]